MNTHQATYETALERIERRMVERDAEAANRNAERDAEFARRDAEAANRDAKRDAEAAKRDAEFAKQVAEFAKRETRLLLAIGGMIAIAVAVLGVLIEF